jgi:lipopolysaccharide/colanic/teichoic acid biosynthesis glycosyltransferase
VEILIAAILFVVALPVMLVAMALVRATSRGSALYSQVRSGRYGRPFRIYKIRTMFHDCERKTGPRWSTPKDPRVTRVGRFLRATHVDELPQLWNVLRGDMSLVGPRPERPEIITQLERALPRYREREAVRPGVTGLAQVQLPPDTELAGVARKLACDLYYIEHASVGLDLRLMAATLLKMVSVPRDLTCRWLAIPRGLAVAEPCPAYAYAPVAVPVSGELPLPFGQALGA